MTDLPEAPMPRSTGEMNRVTSTRPESAEIAMPLRMIVFGRAQTPNLGPTLAVAGRKRVLERLQAHLSA